MAGREREHGIPGPFTSRRPREKTVRINAYHDGVGDAASALLTTSVTDAAKQWEGWGTALKPAYEPIVLARKPLSEPTIAQNVLKHGVGALNIDGCRIAAASWTRQGLKDDMRGGNFASGSGKKILLGDGIAHSHSQGRFPANFLLSHAEDCEQIGVKKVKGITGGGKKVGGQYGNIYGYTSQYDVGKEGYHADADGLEMIEEWWCVKDCPVRMLDEQSGERKAGSKVQGTEPSRTGQNGIYGTYNRVENKPFSDLGGASRFFLTIAPDKISFNITQLNSEHGESNSNISRIRYCPKASQSERGEGNSHPTVKPLALMSYLCKLICPPNGMILDPFMGSGSTLIAASRENFSVIGIEKEPAYIPIAQKRIMMDAPLFFSNRT